jgi:hypothetical protein
MQKVERVGAMKSAPGPIVPLVAYIVTTLTQLEGGRACSRADAWASARMRLASGAPLFATSATCYLWVITRSNVSRKRLTSTSVAVVTEGLPRHGSSRW